MTLGELLKIVPDTVAHGDTSAQISTLTCDSRSVRPGALFFALRGVKSDGHNYINQAVASGAAAIVLENADLAPVDIPWLQVKDGRAAMGHISAFFNGSPTSSRPLLGITGTNGKTTTTYLLEAILAAAAIPAAVLGTISYRFGTTCIEASHTTPESTELQHAFKELADAGAAAFIMEVSSHALEQKRVDGCQFDVGIFSNLTRDHLDYHGTMEKYLDAKCRLFSELLAPTAEKPRRRAVINLDDPSGAEVAERCCCPVTTFGTNERCDVRPLSVSSTLAGIKAEIITPGGEFKLSSPLVGRFNLANILAATAAAVAMGIPLQQIKAGLESGVAVPGRMERVDNEQGITCLVDYAHTGDALENVLLTLKEIAEGRIITVFGCGGDRDNGKRPIMGRIAAELSTLAVVTSDNPRTEEPASIINQIRAGIEPLGLPEYKPETIYGDFSEKGFVVVENRHEAIRLAVSMAKAGDVVLLAGKGHEDYQIIGTQKFHFDDREEAAAALKEMTA